MPRKPLKPKAKRVSYPRLIPHSSTPTERDWTEVVDDFLRLIKDGEVDPHIRAIARACFERRDVLTGSNTVIPDPVQDNKTPVTPKPKVPVKARRVQASKTKPALPDVRTKSNRPGLRPYSPPPGWESGALLREDPFMLADGKTPASDAITLFGTTYVKSDVIGSIISVPYGEPGAQQWGGSTLHVKGIGPKMVLVGIIEEPDAPEAAAHLWDKTVQTYAPHQVLANHL